MSGKRVMQALGALVLVPACAQDSGIFVIVQNQVPSSSSSSSGGCTVPTARTPEFLPAGILDVDFAEPRAYLLFPYMENRLADIETAKDAATFKVDSYRVVVTPDPRLPQPSFADCPLNFEEPLMFFLAAGESTTQSIEVLRACHAAKIKAAFESGNYPWDQTEELYYTVDLTMLGRRGGERIESDHFRYPIRVCYGCLQYGAPDPPITPFCSAIVGANPYKGNPCNFAQDQGPVMCCYDRRDGQPGMPLVCPAPDNVTTTKM